MAQNANRNNFKSILWSITGMMIVLCLGRAVMTLQRISWWQSFISNSITHNLSCFVIFRTKLAKVFLGTFAFYAILIAAVSGFPLFALSIFLLAIFAIMPMPTFSASIFVKIGNRFVFFANMAGFRYDCFRHYFLLDRKFCLEPVAAHTAVGSLYYSEILIRNK